MSKQVDTFIKLFPMPDNKFGRRTNVKIPEFGKTKKKHYTEMRAPNEQDVLNHLTKPNKTIGYTFFQDGKTNVLLFDLDYSAKDIKDIDSWNRVQKEITANKDNLVSYLADIGINTPMIEQSVSNGWHVWLFLDKPIELQEATNFLEYVKEEFDMGSKVDLFPTVGGADGWWTVLPYNLDHDSFIAYPDGTKFDLESDIDFRIDSSLVIGKEKKKKEEEKVIEPSDNVTAPEIESSDNINLSRKEISSLVRIIEHGSNNIDNGHKCQKAFLNVSGNHPDIIKALYSIAAVRSWGYINGQRGDNENEVKKVLKKEVLAWTKNNTDGRKLGYPYLIENGFDIPDYSKSDTPKFGVVEARDNFLELKSSNPWIKVGVSNRFYKYESGIYNKYDREDLKIELEDMLEDKDINFSEANLENTVKKIERRIKFKGDENPPEHLLPIANGLLNLDTLEMQEYTPELFFNAVSPVNYDPTANCKRWLAFIKESFPIESHRQTIQEYFGYALSGDMKQEKYLTIIGDGRNGKGLIAKTLMKLLGGFSTVMDMAHLSESGFELASIVGKRLIYISEVSGSPKNIQTLKKIVGRDAVKAQEKNEKPFDFYPESKIIQTANNLLYRGEDSANRSIDEREIIFRLDNRPVKIDTTLFDTFTNVELEGIFLWALEGYARLRKNGSFTLPKGDPKVNLESAGNSNRFIQFAQDRLEFSGHREDAISQKELREQYTQFLVDEGYKSYTLSNRECNKVLTHAWDKLKWDAQDDKDRTGSVTWFGIRYQDNVFNTTTDNKRYLKDKLVNKMLTKDREAFDDVDYNYVPLDVYEELDALYRQEEEKNNEDNLPPWLN